MKPIRNTLAAAMALLLFSLAPLAALASSGGGTTSQTARTAVSQDVDDASPVPEPGALLLFAAGAIVVGAAIRNKRR